MPFSVLAVVLAAATAAVNMFELAWFGDGYLARQIAAIVAWAGLAAPAACLLGLKTIRTVPAALCVCAGLVLALLLGLYGAWNVLWGPGRDEPLRGLIVVTAPAYQNALLLASLLLAWLVEWRVRASASRDRGGPGGAVA